MNQRDNTITRWQSPLPIKQSYMNNQSPSLLPHYPTRKRAIQYRKKKNKAEDRNQEASQIKLWIVQPCASIMLHAHTGLLVCPSILYIHPHLQQMVLNTSQETLSTRKQQFLLSSFFLSSLKNQLRVKLQLLVVQIIQCKHFSGSLNLLLCKYSIRRSNKTLLLPSSARLGSY